MTQAPPLMDAVSVRHRRFTVEQVYAMLAAGVLSEDDRVELIEGELLEMNPIGSRHGSTVKALNRLFTISLVNQATVGIQDPIQLDDENEVVPDVSILHFREDLYRSAHPGPNDVFLIIEVSDTTLRFDRQVKAKLYARFGIPEYWVADVEACTLEIFREPAAEGYSQSMKLQRPEDEITLRAFPDLKISLKNIMG